MPNKTKRHTGSHTQKPSKKFISIVIILSFFILLPVIYFIHPPVQSSAQNDPQFPANPMKRDMSYMWGPVDKSAFPDITNPHYVSSQNAGSFMKDTDDVYYFRGQTGIYVYPAYILGFHHIVNDTIDNQPLAVTLCLLSNSAIVYSRNMNGKILNLGVLGSLYFGNLVMYDKDDDSYWLQLTGEGLKENQHATLTAVAPLERTTWSSIKNIAGLQVLAPVRDTNFYRQFYDKFAESTVGLVSLKSKKPDPRLKNYTNGLGMTIQNESKYYPENTINSRQIINDTVGGWTVLVTRDTATGNSMIFKSENNGKPLHFIKTGAGLLDKETLSLWNLQGQAIGGLLKGKQLQKPFYTQAYWYSWSSFFPQTTIFAG